MTPNLKQIHLGREPVPDFSWEMDISWEISAFFVAVQRGKEISQEISGPGSHHRRIRTSINYKRLENPNSFRQGLSKVIIGKSRGEASLMEQDTIENVKRFQVIL